jgi:hypothetical protein
MNRALAIVFAFFLFLGSQKALAIFSEADVIELEPNVPKEKFGRSLQYLYDPSAELDLNQVLAPESQKEWKAIEDERPNWGFRDGKLWVYGRILTQDIQDESWVLDLGFHFFVIANFYIKQSDGTWKVSKAGKSEPFLNRELAYRNPAFIFQTSGVPQDFVLELQSPAVLKLPSRIVPLTQFATEPGQFIFALYVGVVLALAIFHFVLGIISKDRVYFIYSLYAIATLMTICDIEGYSYRFLWHDSHWWYVRSATVMACISGITGLLFANEFVRPNKFLSRLIYFMVFFELLFLSLVLVKVNASILMTSHFTLGGAVVLILGVTGWESTQKNPSARIFLGAFCIFGLGLLVFTLQNLGILPSTLLTQHGIGIGQATEILLLSLALSVRINEMKTRVMQSEFENLRLADRFESARWFAHESRRPYHGIV